MGRVGNESICGVSQDCFPSGFDTSRKFGLKLREIHGPVPGYREKLEGSMDRYFERLEVGKFVMRVNVSISFSRSWHPWVWKVFVWRGSTELMRIWTGSGVLRRTIDCSLRWETIYTKAKPHRLQKVLTLQTYVISLQPSFTQHPSNCSSTSTSPNHLHSSSPRGFFSSLLTPDPSPLRTPNPPPPSPNPRDPLHVQNIPHSHLDHQS